MIDDIAKELEHIKRCLTKSFVYSDYQPIIARNYGLNAANEPIKGVRLPHWFIEQGLRIEVNEYDYLDAVRYNVFGRTDPRAVPKVMGVQVYLISSRYEQLPAPGWRIVNPFERQRDKDTMKAPAS